MNTRSIQLIESALSGFTCVANHASRQWFNAHFPAGVLAGVSILLEFDELSPDCKNAIIGSLDRLIETNNEFFIASLYADDSVEKISVKAACSTLESALIANARELTASGHAVIITTLAVKYFLYLDKPVPQSIVDGLLKVIKWTEEDNPKRYFGYQNYKHQDIDMKSIEHVLDVDAAIAHCVTHQGSIFEDQELDGDYYYFTGDKLHELTHAQTLSSLERLGFDNLVTVSLKNLKKQIILNQQKPINQIGHKCRQYLDPFEKRFWERKFSDPHQIKLAYAVMEFSKSCTASQKSAFLTDTSVYWDLLS